MKRSSFVHRGRAHAAGIALLLLARAAAGEPAAASHGPPAPVVADFRLEGERWTGTADGQPARGVLLLPDGPGPFPAVVLSHGLGGSGEAMMAARGRDLVREGFACIAPDYTHAGAPGGRGGRGRAALDQVDFATAGARSGNVARARACVEILRGLKEVDPRRIAAYGHSMGAFVTIALAAAEPDRLAAAAITAGGVAAGDYRAASAPAPEVAEKVRVPFLILHGSADTTVAPGSSAKLKEILDANRVPCDRRVFDGVGHNLPVERGDECGRLIRDWFARHGVKPGPAGAPAAAGPAGEAEAEGPPAEESAAAGGGGGPPWATDRVEAPHLQYRTIASTAAHATVSYHVYVPAAYDEEKARRFPVLYWLHGSGGGLAGLAPLVAQIDAAVRDGRAPPMLVVFPNGLPNGMWCDSADGRTPVETVLLREVLPDVDASFRTIAAREGRLVEGFSMGGYGAARLGFKYPDLFAGVSMFAAGPLQPDFTEAPRAGLQRRDEVLNAVYGGDFAIFRAQSPWILAEQHAEALRDGRPIRMAVGDRDETCENNRNFARRLAALGIARDFAEIPGVGHDPRALLDALGDGYWAFYRRVFGREPGAARAPAVAAAAPAAEGTSLVRRTWTLDGVAREALVRIPPGAATNPAPVVFGFHGHGGTMRNAARTFGIERLWPEAVVVYMQGLNTPGRLTDPEGKRPGWQHAPGDQGDRDLKFFDAVLATLKKECRVDERRIYSTGHSNGGGFTYLLWATRGDVFAAMAPSGSAAAGRVGELLKPKPALHVAGTNDPLVKYEWQAQTIEGLRKLNGCGDGEPWGDGGTCYPSRTGTPVVTLIHDGGHGFPPSAPPQIVKFFQAHPKPAAAGR